MTRPLTLLLSLALAAPTLAAQTQPGLAGAVPHEAGNASTVVPPQLENVSFEQRLGERLPLDARFRDERGREVALGDYFGRRPVVLAFVYYSCPMLCTQVLNGVSSAVKAMPFEVGRDFDVVYVSFDPRDTPQQAAAKKDAQMADYGEADAAGGWHYLSAPLTAAGEPDETPIRRVAEAAGFSYRFDERSGQYAHVSGVLVLTPDGQLSRYFYGVEYSPKELRMALVESSEGKVGSMVDRLLLYCYHYDPTAGRYGVIAMNLVRLGGAVTLVVLGSFLWVMRRRDLAAEKHA